MSELRCDPLLKRWVLIAPGRESRPDDFAVAITNGQPDHPCPFCEGNESLTGPEVLVRRSTNSTANGPGWDIRVVPNRYPAVAPEPASQIWGATAGFSESGWGRHEVIVETPRHLPLTATHAPEHWHRLFEVFQQRLMDFRTVAGLQHAIVFKNHGPAAGASLMHPHCQVIALPRVPDAVTAELQAGEQRWHQAGKCPRCELLDAEIEAGTRLVATAPEVVAWCPPASRFPYETWLLPRQHSSHFESADPGVLAELARQLSGILTRLEQVVPGLSYNLVLQTAPLHAPALAGFHWRLEILPRLTGMAGFEWGSGWFINPVAPERAARELRCNDRLGEGG